jgi:2-polyprenyl-3-methyl-5-hydroxy-6-metoxy-1,4-benzoquinol methylase
VDSLDRYRLANFRNWESRVAVHAASRTYDLAGLAADPARLSDVVAYDKPWLGDLGGLDVVHVQCHIGSDTISLARLGARITGVDFSPRALEVARDLAVACGIEARFVESDVYAVPGVLGAGALNWLPDIGAWARVVAGLLRPGGRLYVRDAHPMMNTVYADHESGDLRVLLPYFEGYVLRWESDATYTDGPPVSSPEQFEWNHGLGEIVQAVIDAGLRVTALREHRECEWQDFKTLVEGDDRKFRLPDMPERLPLMFTLEACRPG